MEKVSIQSIEFTNQETGMYDLSVEDNHNFILENGIISHNSGKTATALYLAEQAHEKGGHKVVYYVGTPEYKDLYPKWLLFVKSLDDLPINSFALIDEAAIKFNARDFNTQGNKQLTKKMTILRHQNITIVLLTQNIQMVETNIDRLADIILFKMGINYGLRKRKGESIPAIEKQKLMIMEHLKPRTKEDCLIQYLLTNKPVFRKIKNPLPSFWDDEKISKSFIAYKAEQVAIKEKAKAIHKKEERKSILGIS